MYSTCVYIILTTLRCPNAALPRRSSSEKKGAHLVKYLQLRHDVPLLVRRGVERQDLDRNDDLGGLVERPVDGSPAAVAQDLKVLQVL